MRISDWSSDVFSSDLDQRLQGEGRRAEVAADLHLTGGELQDVANERGGGRLAVGAGDADVAGVALGARQELDVADDLDAVLLGLGDHRMGLRKAVRDARRVDKAGDIMPINAVAVDTRDRQSVVEGKSELVRVSPGGRRDIYK